MPSIKDVAKKAGVSIATVSHVINKTRYVTDQTQQKVLQAMDELSYHPNNVARSLRSSKSRIIGFLTPDISNFFFTGIARRIEKDLRQNGYNLILGNSDENIEIEKEQIKIFNSQLIDGLIIAPTAHDHSFLYNMLNDRYPVVFIDRKPKNYEGDYVLVDNNKGAYEAVNYLIQRGHKNIGIITGLPGLTTTEERLEGYKQCLLENNINIDEELIKIGDSRFESGYSLTKELLTDNSNVSALFVTNNLMSIGAMKYLKEYGVNAPDELAIIGFDDYKWATITTPSLSVVKQPIEDIGKFAVKLLLRKINKKSAKKEKHCLPTKLIIRDSC